MENKDKIILSLCGGSGAWEKPYKDNGYDIRNITSPEYDVRTYTPPDNVYGILAAPPCFEGDVLVMTSGGFKKIKDIAISEKVLTHTNTFKKVTNIMKHWCTKAYTVKVPGVLPFVVTENHPFYTRQMKRVWDNKKRSYVRNFNIPQWVNVKNLDKSHYVGIAINQRSQIPEWKGINIKVNQHKTKGINELNFKNKSFWWIIGRYIGDGWCRFNEKERRYVVLICCNKVNGEINDILKHLKSLSFSYSVNNQKTTKRVEIYSKELVMYLKQFGKGAGNKRLTQDILDLPIKLLKSFLKGYISADGSYDKQRDVYSVSSISKELIYGIQSCVHKVYKKTGCINKTIPPIKFQNRTINNLNNLYSFLFKKESNKQDSQFYEKGYIWIPFRKKEKREYNSYVYNLKVASDESYTIFNIIVHNCTQFSFARTKAKIPRKLEEGMELIFACLKIIWKCQYNLDNDQQRYSPLKFWALENPFYGSLSWFLGKPALIFNPYDYGDAYQKKTSLWGKFNDPERNPVELSPEMKELAKKNNYLHRIGTKFDMLKTKDISLENYGKYDIQTRRAITPSRFAKAFFMSNQ